MTTLTASVTRRSPLRTVLALDAAVSGLNGLAYVAAAGRLDSMLGIDAGTLRAVGVFLLAYAAVVALVAARPARRAVQGVIAANAVWAADSIVVAALGWGSPTGAGRAWIVLQAVTVAGLAAAQSWALRRSE